MVPEVPKFVFSIFRIFFLRKNFFFDFLTPPWPFFGATKILDNAIFGSWAIYYRKYGYFWPKSAIFFEAKIWPEGGQKSSKYFRRVFSRWRILMTPPPDPLQNRSGIFQIHSDTAPKRSTSNTKHDSSKSMKDRGIDWTYCGRVKMHS